MIPIEYYIVFEEWQKVKSLSNLLLHYGSSKLYSKWVARFKAKNLWPCKLNEAERIARRRTYLKLWRAQNKDKTRYYVYKHWERKLQLQTAPMEAKADDRIEFNVKPSKKQLDLFFNKIQT